MFWNGGVMKLSVVIPCYGSEKTIEGVVEEVTSTVSQRNIDYEIILVNDSSPDNVWEVIVRLTEENDKITGINFSKNFGQHSALLAGYRACTGDVILSMDDDGQTPANELFSLVDKLEEGYDVVYGTYGQKKHSWFRNFGSNINNYMCEKLLGKPKGFHVTSFFVAKKYIIDEICRYKNPYSYIIGLVFRTTNNIDSVEVNHRAREVGHSGYTMKKLLNLWMNGFTAFSIKPLRIATMLGVICALLGFLYTIYIVINHFCNPLTPIGWSSTIAAIMVVGGLILCVLGMIGEYLGRVYISINDAPQYVIKETKKKE